MRRITTWLLSTVSALVLLFSYHTSTSSLPSTAILGPLQSGGTGANGGAAGASGAGSAAGPAGTSGSTSGSAGGSGTSAGGSGTSAGGSGTSAGGSGTSAGGSGTSAGGSGTSAGGSGTTVAGDVVNTRWGPVQVQITVAAGKITKADVLEVPWNSNLDMQINSYAVPIYNQEAVKTQSSHIDMISGATVTYGGYVGSLQSAIDKAHL